jgi:hypothetical protein
MIEWKWTLGEPYERSQRLPKHTQDIQIENENDPMPVVVEQNAYLSSLNHDENTWDMMNPSFVENSFENSNKREYTDQKLAERQIFGQINMNPFMTNNNYVEDITTRDQFLKPMATNWDREKKQDIK